MHFVASPHHMSLVGFLFGLGFDTATEIALPVLAGSSAATGLPWYAVLCLPILFAAGMSLFDTIDSSLMTRAYGWASTSPVHRFRYDLGLTALSAAIGFVVGTIQIAGLVRDRVRGVFWQWFSSIDLDGTGVIIVALFVAIWLVAILAANRKQAATRRRR